MEVSTHFGDFYTVIIISLFDTTSNKYPNCPCAHHDLRLADLNTINTCSLREVVTYERSMQGLSFRFVVPRH